jgi:hypothetical protein
VRLLRWQLWWLLIWSHRHTVGLWWRSLRGEIKAGRRVDFGRVRTLLAALYAVSSESRLSNAPQLRTLAVATDTVVAEADGHWHERELLGHILRGIDHINEVRFVDTGAGAPVAA